MKRYFLFSIVCSALISFSACTNQKEIKNSEADIIEADISANNLLLDQPVINNNTVQFSLKQQPQDYVFAPKFKLTPGASISPLSGTELNFSTPQNYTVVSENGQWEKTYEVSFSVSDMANYYYSFEQADTINTTNPEGHYHRFYDYSSDGHKRYVWASGNPGYNILAATLVPEGETLTPAFYPTAQTPNGYEGKGVVMTTKGTGSLGEMMGSPLAAGNLFIGEFQLTFPTINATHFGKPYLPNTAPTQLKGYFKYNAGEDFTVNTSPSELTKDTWDAYAILFEKRETDNYLLGDHNFDDPRIVSVARLDAAQAIESDQWRPFEIPFHVVDGKTFDPNKSYMITIVFSSSKEGAIYNGAIGSTLSIDEVQLITE